MTPPPRPAPPSAAGSARPAPDDAQAAPRAVPADLRDVFTTFTRLALQGFGGVLPVAQRELVERKRWLSRAEFLEMLSVSQVLPGPNVVNLALMLGDRFFGLRGAGAALAGMLLAPTVVVLTLTVLYARFAQWPLVTGALRGMGAVAAGLILSTACKLLGTLRTNPLGMPAGIGLAALTAFAMAWWRWPLVWVVSGLGTFAIGLAWRRLAR